MPIRLNSPKQPSGDDFLHDPAEVHGIKYTVQLMRILGIETSCDETAAAVVESASRRRLKLLSNVIASSVDLHVAYGGVVPEIAARSHIESILPVIDKALADAKTNWGQIDAIAVTNGPGLAGSLLIGVLTARTLAIAKNKPLHAVNHVEAHIYAAFLTEKAKSSQLKAISLNDKQPEFPILALIVSGGHTQLVLFRNHFNYKLLGQTADDAAGEAFDKVAKILGLPYPGGPSVSKIAAKGNSKAFKFPKAQMSNSYDFSFSGLKTAVLRATQSAAGQDYTFESHKLAKLLSARQKADIAASFQHTAVTTLLDSLAIAIWEHKPKSVVIAGGVAANQHLRSLAKKIRPAPVYPDIKLCTDNAAMIAVHGYYQASQKRPTADPYSLEIAPDLSMLAPH